MALREISLTLTNRPGALAGVARMLAAERINLAAVSVDSTAGRGRVRLIVSAPERALELLQRAGFEPEVREMIAVRLEDRAGSFLKVLEVLARARVNLVSAAILVAREGNQPLVALGTSNPARARTILARAGFASEIAEGVVSNSDLLAGAASVPDESVGLLL
ncbi:MAG TPA: ACT domain-containing protein [Thermoplasmata archaeon]|nr:ACT domain-containing protein [Thermoplasmata archaeon]